MQTALSDHPVSSEDWNRLDRFLLLGSEQGAYIVRGVAHTITPPGSLISCLQQDGYRVVQAILHRSRSARIYCSDSTTYALAVAASLGDEQTRRYALDALPDVCGRATQLFAFATFIESMRGWGRGLRTAIGRWYSRQSVQDLAYHAVKQVANDGWSHRDLLRLAHPRPDSDARRILYHWITQGWERIGDAPHDQPELQVIWAAEKARVPGTTAKTIAELIRTYSLPWEAVPVGVMNESIVWEALLEKLPVRELLQFLPTLTRTGILDSRIWQSHVIQQIRDSSLSPIELLVASKSYQDHQQPRSSDVQPISRIVDALDSAFYDALPTSRVSGLRWHVAIEVNPEFAQPGIPRMNGVTANTAAMAMTLGLVCAETDVTVTTLSRTVSPLPMSASQRLEELVPALTTTRRSHPDLSLPLRWAASNTIETDVFLVICESIHSAQAARLEKVLAEYRRRLSISAKLIVIGMLSRDNRRGDWTSPNTLAIAGFDTSIPDLIHDFVSLERSGQEE